MSKCISVIISVVPTYLNTETSESKNMRKHGDIHLWLITYHAWQIYKHNQDTNEKQKQGVLLALFFCLAAENKNANI